MNSYGVYFRLIIFLSEIFLIFLLFFACERNAELSSPLPQPASSFFPEYSFLRTHVLFNHVLSLSVIKSLNQGIE